MFSIYYNIHSTDKDTMVVIDATGTDCYSQAAVIFKKIQGPLALKSKGQLLLCYELCTLNLAEIVVQFYTMTGYDSTNRFYGHGKNWIYDKISRVSHLRDLIIDVGKEPPLSDSVRKKSMKKKSTLRLCPDDDTLDHYCEPVNYLSHIQLHSEVYNHPSPIGHGWMLVDGPCHPVRNRLLLFQTT